MLQPQLLFTLNDRRNKLNQQSTEIHEFSSASVLKFNLSLQARNTVQFHTHYNTTSHYEPALKCLLTLSCCYVDDHKNNFLITLRWHKCFPLHFHDIIVCLRDVNSSRRQTALRITPLCVCVCVCVTLRSPFVLTPCCCAPKTHST